MRLIAIVECAHQVGEIIAFPTCEWCGSCGAIRLGSEWRIPKLHTMGKPREEVWIAAVNGEMGPQDYFDAITRELNLALQGYLLAPSETRYLSQNRMANAAIALEGARERLTVQARRRVRNDIATVNAIVVRLAHLEEHEASDSDVAVLGNVVDRLLNTRVQ